MNEFVQRMQCNYKKEPEVKPVSLLRKIYNLFKMFNLFMRDQETQFYLNELLKDKVSTDYLFRYMDLSWKWKKCYLDFRKYRNNLQGVNIIPPTFISVDADKEDCLKKLEDSCNMTPETSLPQEITKQLKEQENEQETQD